MIHVIKPNDHALTQENIIMKAVKVKILKIGLKQ